MIHVTIVTTPMIDYPCTTGHFAIKLLSSIVIVLWKYSLEAVLTTNITNCRLASRMMYVRRSNLQIIVIFSGRIYKRQAEVFSDMYIYVFTKDLYLAFSKI